MNPYLEEIKTLQFVLEEISKEADRFIAGYARSYLEASKNRMKSLHYPTDMDVPQRSDNETRQ